MWRGRRLGGFAVALFAILSTHCGSSTASTSPTSSLITSSAVLFHGETSDAQGDAVVSAGVGNPPDLIRGTVDVTGTSITFTIQFASGTMNAQTTRLTIQLDTDQNPSTGVPGGNGVGIDYIVDLWAVRAQQTLVQQAQPASCTSGGTCYTDVGSVSASVGTDTLSTTVPLAMLGNASGRMNYRVFAYASPQTTAPTVVADVMPDITGAPAHVP
jgi:hypothetical protein